MRISPIKNHQNQVSHKAVNQKLLKQAKNEYLKYAPYHNQGHLLTMIEIRHAYQLLSTQDTIDTLTAIKPYSSDALELIDNLIEKYKRILKQESNQ